MMFGRIGRMDRDLLFNLLLLFALVLVYIATLIVCAIEPALAGQVQGFGLGTVCGGILTAIQRGNSGKVGGSDA